MSVTIDPIRKSPPDRLHYATGELLGADDFVQEQTYHRRQLAQALLFLHGRGTVAGLRAITSTQPRRDEIPAGTTEFTEIQLMIEPGLAIDGAGRFIEVSRSACLRLRRWFNYIASRPAGTRTRSNPAWDIHDLTAAWREDAALPGGGAVIADIFLAFHACDRGYTPAFSSGPFDSLDASQPSRVRDGYELSLVLRPADVPLPAAAFDPWQDVTGTPDERLQKVRAASLNAWHTLTLPTDDTDNRPPEIPAGVDPAAVLIARLKLPASRPPDDTKLPGAVWSTDAWSAPDANIDNNIRNFILPAAALRRLAS